MIGLYLALIALGSVAIVAAVRGSISTGIIASWPVRIMTADGDIIVHRDGTVEWQRGTQFRPLRVVSPSYWEEAH